MATKVTTVKKVTMKKIESTISKGRHGVTLKEFVKYGDEKLRFNIYSDSYDFQCKASVSIYNKNDKKWNNLYSILPADMSTSSKLSYRQYSERDFTTDLNRLKKMAKAIID